MTRFDSGSALVSAVLIMLFASGLSHASDRPDLPAIVDGSDWLPLRQHVDADLQSRLRRQLETRREWKKLIAANKLAVGLVDLSNPSAPRYADVNGDVEMYAASLPKIAILLASFDQFQKGRLERTPELEEDLVAMIRTSSNRAATRMIDQLGGLATVNAVLQDSRYRFYDEDDGGGLWVGKRYAKRGPRLPDPLKGLSHAATVRQICRFYYQLATGRLISPQASAEMLEMLSKPGINHKFVKPLRERAPAARLYRKSGTWKHWHADSVLVWGTEWRRYILVALAESPKGEQILRRLVGVAEETLRPPPSP